jgi:beta-barrel assembly-enhancing protease
MQQRTLFTIVGPLAFAISVPLWAEYNASFSFSRIDLSLLDQVQYLAGAYEKQGLVYHDESLNAYVNEIGRAMLPANTAPDHVKWDFQVLRDPMPNAFALPNGMIYVNTGLLSLLENEDQLASVLAHEITHVTDRHAYLHYRDYRKKMAVANVVSYVASFAPGNSAWGAAIQAGGALVPFVMMASINGYSRELEKDADIYSFNKLIEGGYDPREMLSTFRLLEQTTEVDVSKMYYTDHPKLDERIAYLSDLVNAKAPKPVPPEVLAQRKMKYRALTEAAVREDVRLSILSHRPRTALARVAKLIDFHPNSADNAYAQAEAYRALGPWTPRPTELELSDKGRKEIRNLNRKFTPEEEEHQLMEKESGRATSRENQRSAEEAYQKALSIDPAHAKSYRGLGQLFEKEQKRNDAVLAYQKYLELQPNSLDAHQIQQRIEGLQRSLEQQ